MLGPRALLERNEYLMQNSDMTDSPRDTGDRRSKDRTAPRPRAYEAPAILCVEPLEVAAALCDPPAGGFGKSGPPLCGTMGS